MSTLSSGDKVQLKPAHAGKWGGTIFTFKKRLKVNIEVEAPNGRRLRGVPELFDKIEDTSPNDKDETTVPVTFLSEGNIVLVSHPFWTGGAGPFVVLATNYASNTVRITDVGGDGLIWKNVRMNHCTKIELSELARLIG